MIRCSTRTLRLCAFAVPLVATLGLGGCGQKGPLFAPQEKLDQIERKRDERESDKAPAKTGSLAPAPVTYPNA